MCFLPGWPPPHLPAGAAATAESLTLVSESIVTMAAESDVLHFQFEQQGDVVLQKMNLLRQQNLFCDVSIYINDTEFQGHKVILAACSTFMRDQFLLTQSKHVRITILQSAEIGRKLLLSCYTGALEVKRKELLKYLTAASYLQMVHIVEKCTEALSKYLEIDLSMKNNNQHVDLCQSSDPDVKNEDENSDKDCEIIEISEDSPVNIDFHVKEEESNILQSTVESLTAEREEMRSPELSSVDMGFKDNEIRILHGLLQLLLCQFQEFLQLVVFSLNFTNTSSQFCAHFLRFDEVFSGSVQIFFQLCHTRRLRRRAARSRGPRERPLATPPGPPQLTKHYTAK
ncbi:hypothetical protein AB1E18_009049 [Capra hircus]